MTWEHFEDFDFSEGSHGKAILIIQNFHLFNGNLFIGIFVLGKKDDAIGTLADYFSFLKLSDESTVQGIHWINL